MKGRPVRAVPRIRRDLRLREDLVAQIDLLLLDPTSKRIAYGAWSDLVETLMTEWLTKQIQGASGAKPLLPHKAVIALNMLESATVVNWAQVLPEAIKLLRESLGLGVKP